MNAVRKATLLVLSLFVILTVAAVQQTLAQDKPVYSRPNRPVRPDTPEDLARYALENQGIGFSKSALGGETNFAPTTLQFGPDNRLYVADVDGIIRVYSVARNAANDYDVVNTETITHVKNIPNYNDDGSTTGVPTDRQVTGLLVTGTAANPVLYVSSSDPRIGGNSSGTDTNLDTNSGTISRLTQTTPGTWAGADMLHIVRGLPRSEENHSPNGMAISTDGSTLYLAQGGNTNMGAPSNNFADLPEYALAGAILAIDLAAIGETTYDVPTLDDPTRGSGGQPAENDPFGGNDGQNQAKVMAGGPVTVFAPGYRNSYDVLLMGDGRLYTIDNGPNVQWGDVPINEGPAGNCTNGINEPGETQWDNLHFVAAPGATSGAYGGQPNPTRGNPAGIFASESVSPVPFAMAHPVECDYRDVETEDNALTIFYNSTNGMAEYTASNFSGAMQGDIVTAGWNSQKIFRVVLDTSSGVTPTVTLNTTLFNSVGDNPLDVVAQGDADIFPGTIWVVSLYGGGPIWVYEPNDYGGSEPPACSGAYNLLLDEDSDGYSNADEIDNGTSPCSAADVPPDHDQDRISDLNDADDDNDLVVDALDPFAIDASNGLTRTLPINYTWELGAPDPGGFLNLGFTGLMKNDVDDYLDLYDETNMTAGGATGILTIDAIPEGEATGATNSQEYGFQFGFDVASESLPFTAHTAIVGPFSAMTPEDNQSMGLFLGTGDQDDYLKVVVHANGGAGGVAVASELAGVYKENLYGPAEGVNVLGAGTFHLYLTADPQTGAVQPAFRRDGGPITNVGSPIAAPLDWFDGPEALAVGIISTSAGPGPVFPASWEEITVSRPTGNWEAITTGNEPAARHEGAFLQVNGKFYLLGGRGDRPVQEFDPVTGLWTTLSDPPLELHHFQAVAYDGLIYILGAWTDNYPNEVNVGTIYIYDPREDRWTSGPEIPLARQRGSGGTVVYNDEIYLVGGIVGGHGSHATAVPWLDKWDPRTNTWTTLTDAPRARDHFHAAVVGDKLVVAGGRDSGVTNFANNTIAETDIYDLTSGLWSTLPSPAGDIPTERAGTGSVAYNSEVLVIGGEGFGNAYAETEALDVATGTWRALAPLNQQRHGTQATLCDGGVYIAAGNATQGGGAELTDPERLFLLGSAGCAPPANPAALAPATAVLNFGDVVVDTQGIGQLMVTHSGAPTDPDIVVDPAYIVGADAGFFSLVGALAPEGSTVLMPGESMTLTLSFAPTSVRSFTGATAALVVPHSGANSALAVPLQGEGVVPSAVGLQGATAGSETAAWLWPLAVLLAVLGALTGVLQSRRRDGGIGG